MKKKIAKLDLELKKSDLGLSGLDALDTLLSQIKTRVLALSDIDRKPSSLEKCLQSVSRKPKKKPIPVLLAVPIPSGKCWHAWCPFCKTYHMHGAVAGHHVAHCANENSPFKETGYMLRELKKPYGKR